MERDKEEGRWSKTDLSSARCFWLKEVLGSVEKKSHNELDKTRQKAVKSDSLSYIVFLETKSELLTCAVHLDAVVFLLSLRDFCFLRTQFLNATINLELDVLAKKSPVMSRFPPKERAGFGIRSFFL